MFNENSIFVLSKFQQLKDPTFPEESEIKALETESMNENSILFEFKEKRKRN